MLGSDTVGRFGDYLNQIRIYDALFDALGDPDLIERLATRNFLRIMHNDGVKLDANYHYPEEKYSRRALTPP